MEDIDRLYNEILKNPERIKGSDITPEQVKEIKKRLNTYSCTIKNNPNHYSLMSFTNWRVEYIKRFLTTALVGYLFRAHEETEVPPDVRRWDGPFMESDPISEENLLKLSDEIADITKQYREEKDEKKKQVLHYILTQRLVKNGKVAEPALGKTVKKLLEDQPDRKPIVDAYGFTELSESLGKLEVPNKIAHGIITNFLTSLFEFDPNFHVKTAQGLTPTVKPEDLADKFDPTRVPLNVIKRFVKIEVEEQDKEAYAYVSRSKELFRKALNVIREPLLPEDQIPKDEKMKYVYDNRERFRRYLYPIDKDSPANPAIHHIPPQDTYYRFDYYTEVNFEELRTATEAIYHTKPQLEWALALWHTFECSSPEEAKATYNAFVEKYRDDLPTDIFMVQSGGWTMLGDFKQNREVIDFYNKETEILKRIMDQNLEDRKLGKELLKNRVKKMKAETVRKAGPDDPGLAKSLEAIGSTKAGIPEMLTHEERIALEKANGNLKKAKEYEELLKTEKRIKELNDLKVRNGNKLPADEERELTILNDTLTAIKDNIDVPEDKIQTNIFVQKADGQVVKEQVYIDADPEPPKCVITNDKGKVLSDNTKQ